MNKYRFLLSVALALSLFGIASASIVSQSHTYWRGTSPFILVNAVQLPNGTLTFEIQNNAPQNLMLRQINITNESGNIVGSQLVNYEIKSGSKQAVGITTQRCTERQLVKYGLSFGYDSGEIKNVFQVGARPLSLRCNKQFGEFEPSVVCTGVSFNEIIIFDFAILLAGILFLGYKKVIKAEKLSVNDVIKILLAVAGIIIVASIVLSLLGQTCFSVD